MTAETDEQAFEILRSRQIDCVLLWPQKAKPDAKEQSKEDLTFSHRLCEGQITPWLKKVKLPENMADGFLVFETDF
ncbi:MAG: hypothetical protein B6I25_05215 [Planctomycetales bacterium 4572_13]|nr:MAG: hypothetical protein B6I25_05215 [Planctomycetales bacterium 4572_13]